jgi:hypothetical protein
LYLPAAAIASPKERLSHVLKASLQIYIWKSSQKAQPPVRSPLMFGWEDKSGLVPVFYRGANDIYPGSNQMTEQHHYLTTK